MYLPTDATMVICHLTVCHVGKELFLLQTDRQGFDTVGFCLCSAMSDTQNILQPLHSLQNPLIHYKKENVITWIPPLISCTPSILNLPRILYELSSCFPEYSEGIPFLGVNERPFAVVW